jgi:hypothetical protein
VRVQVGRAVKRRRVAVGRFEELVPFVLELLDRNGLLTEHLRESVEQAPPTNASEHGSYRDYYDRDLRELVAHKARWLTERFGYAF